MKRLLAVATLAILASCGNSRKDEVAILNDKKVRLEKLKTDQKKIADEISTLEAEIAEADPAARSLTARLVTATEVTAGEFSHYIELQGKVDARNISYVAPPNGQGGIVKQLYIRRGQSVRKGQVLARLDDQILRQQLEPLRVQLNAAEDTYQRTKNLWDQGIGTYQQVLTAQTQVENLKKSMNIIRQQIAQMTVTAPASGVAEVVNIHVGEAFVGANAAGPQIVLVNTSDLKVVVEVPENYISRVNAGSYAEVFLPQQSGRRITGKVGVVGKLINPTTRSFTVEINIPADPKLKPNEVAQVKILDYSATGVVTIPLNTVQTDEQGKYVYIAAREGNQYVARKKPVVTGESYGNLIEIRTGLQPGDQLVTEGYLNLYEGQLLTLSGI